VEKGEFRSEHTTHTVDQALGDIKGQPIDCLILGCTHYPFLMDTIQDVMGQDVKLISSADETAREISTILYDKRKLASGDETPVHQFFCTGDPRMFQNITKQWLGEQISKTPVVWQVTQLS
jgi:glutamate racemase